MQRTSLFRFNDSVNEMVVKQILFYSALSSASDSVGASFAEASAA